MKRAILFVLMIALMVACKKKEENFGTVNYTLTYARSTTDSKAMQSDASKGTSDTLYSQFGDYITSLTPAIFKAKFLFIDYHNDKPLGTNGDVEDGGYGLSIINGDLPPTAPEHFADFTGNATISVTPALGGDLDNETVFSADEIHFIYLLAIFEYLYQEVELPSQYDSIVLTQFALPDVEITGRTLKVKDNRLVNGIYSQYGINDIIHLIAFGNTDSSYVSSTEGNNTIWGNQGGNVLRSNKYSELVFHKPAEGATFTINTILSFNYNNLIQVYAGADNIPYTSDDVMVYRPKFWDRLHVTVTTN